jgi:hypothetical protein
MFLFICLGYFLQTFGDCLPTWNFNAYLLGIYISDLLGIPMAKLIGICIAWNISYLPAWDIYCLPAWDIFCLPARDIISYLTETKTYMVSQLVNVSSTRKGMKM